MHAIIALTPPHLFKLALSVAKGERPGDVHYHEFFHCDKH